MLYGLPLANLNETCSDLLDRRVLLWDLQLHRLYVGREPVLLLVGQGFGVAEKLGVEQLVVVLAGLGVGENDLILRGHDPFVLLFHVKLRK